jgi:hypothetical protein
MPTATPKQMSSGELTELLTLTTVCSDTVELKLTIPDSDQRPTTRALGIDPFEAEVRQLVYFDTRGLDLDRLGLAISAERVRGSIAHAVVQVTPMAPGSLPAHLRVGEDFALEVEVTRGGFVSSGILTGADGSRDGPIRNLFSKPQLALIKQQTSGRVDLDALSPLGPIFVLELSFSAEGFARPMVTEMWLYPDGSRTVELSTKCSASEAFDVAAEARAFLSERGVELDTVQHTNVRAALEYFSDELTVIR